MSLLPILHRRRFQQQDRWYYLAGTKSTSAAMAFDRLRLSNLAGVEVGIVPPQPLNQTSIGLGQDSLGVYLTGSVYDKVQQIQPFQAGGGWTSSSDEHDFSFDCSSFAYGNGNDDAAAIVIKNIDETNIFWQLYAYPTGFGGTRGKNAELVTVVYETLKIATVGSEIGRLRLTNQIPWAYHTMTSEGTFPIHAKEVRMEGTSVFFVQDMFRSLVLAGETSGTFSYTESERPKSGNQQAIDDYNTLISRSWSITGGAPT
jgi:hypothetical protein